MDSYADVAMIYVGFFCDECPTYFSDDELGKGVSPDWDAQMGQKAKELGWHVAVKPSNEDWEVLCPTCANKRLSSCG